VYPSVMVTPCSLFSPLVLWRSLLKTTLKPQSLSCR